MRYLPLDSVDRWYAEAIAALAQRNKPIEQIVQEHNADTEIEQPRLTPPPTPRPRKLRVTLSPSSKKVEF